LRRPLLVLPAWLPNERTLTAGLVLLLVLVVALGAGRGAQLSGAPAGPPGETDGNASQLAAIAPSAGLDSVDPAATAAATVIPVPTVPPPAPSPTYVPAPHPGSPVAAYTSRQIDGALLPDYRILTYYGHPLDENMGIVGEYPKEEVLALLRAEAANYEAVDPTRPIIAAFEVIATVAQPEPQNDGTYLLETDPETIQEFIDFAAANDAIVILDVQIGRSTVADQIEVVRPYLEQPNVHLGLDPEFAIAEGETPGLHIGAITAAQVTYAQETLAALAADRGIPPKLLIVHQFREDMIVGKPEIRPVPGVQLVLDADGFGAPELKTEVYNILVRDEPIEFAGIKLFYTQDNPVMTPAQILALSPSPDVIIYQ